MTFASNTDRSDAMMARLPKWAQREIETLQMRLAEHQQRITELSAGPENSNVIVSDYGYPDRLLGRDTRIRFLLGEDGYIEVRHQRSNPGILEIVSGGAGLKGALHITPQVSNAVRVRIGEY